MIDQHLERLGISANCIPIFLDRSDTNVEYHLLETPDLISLVREVVPSIQVINNDQIVVECDLGRIVGTTNLVETMEGDEIVYAKRIGRNTYSRFVKNKQPTACSSIVVVLRKGEAGYYLWTAMCAKLLPKEAWIDGSLFNQTHAIAYDEKLVQPSSLMASRPSH